MFFSYLKYNSKDEFQCFAISEIVKHRSQPEQ